MSLLDILRDVWAALGSTGEELTTGTEVF